MYNKDERTYLYNYLRVWILLFPVAYHENSLKVECGFDTTEEDMKLSDAPPPTSGLMLSFSANRANKRNTRAFDSLPLTLRWQTLVFKDVEAVLFALCLHLFLSRGHG